MCSHLAVFPEPDAARMVRTQHGGRESSESHGQTPNHEALIPCLTKLISTAFEQVLPEHPLSLSPAILSTH